MFLCLFFDKNTAVRVPQKIKSLISIKLTHTHMNRHILNKLAAVFDEKYELEHN